MLKQYKNKKWLFNKYWNEELSSIQIAKLCGVTGSNIQYWMKKFNIPTRTTDKRIHLFNRKKIGNDKYCNKKWLYKKYWIEKLSTYQIAELCKTSHTTIKNWMKKFDITIRSYSEAFHLARGNHCILSREAIEWISGELLGDGCLIADSSYSAYFRYGSKFLEYIQYVSETLKSFSIEQVGKINENYDKKRKNRRYFYCSRAYPELLSIYKQWYPDGKKIIPRDLDLTPLTLRQFYIGDGSLRKKKGCRPHVTLATCGFSIPDTNWIIERLIKLKFRATRQPARNIIAISTYSAKNFLDYISDCPVKCYQYKFNYEDKIIN